MDVQQLLAWFQCWHHGGLSFWMRSRCSRCSRGAVNWVREEGTGVGVPTLDDRRIIRVWHGIVRGKMVAMHHPVAGGSRRNGVISRCITGLCPNAFFWREEPFTASGEETRFYISLPWTANSECGTVFQSCKRSQSAMTVVTTLTAFCCGHVQFRAKSVSGDSSDDRECWASYSRSATSACSSWTANRDPGGGKTSLSTGVVSNKQETIEPDTSKSD